MPALLDGNWLKGDDAATSKQAMDALQLRMSYLVVLAEILGGFACDLLQ